MVNKNKWIIGGMTLLTLIGLPAGIFLSQQRQETRSRASASTTLSFQPTNTSESPLQTSVGQSVPLDVYISPGGNNQIAQVKLEISYDPATLTPASSPFTLNTDAFPTTLDGPVVQNGKIIITAATGANPAKALVQPTRVGTVNFTAASSTSTPQQVSFGPGTYALSFAAEDQHNENVLSTTSPTFVSISGSSTTTLTPSQEPQGTRLNLKVSLGGIGKDVNPQRTNRNFEVSIFNGQNQLAASPKGTLTYNPAEGNFTGVLAITENLSTGAYLVKIKSSGYLTKLLPGSITLTAGQATTLPPATLPAGDINLDNALNTLDYSLIQSCYGTNKAPTCTAEIEEISDLNDDGLIDIIDLNIYLREVSTKTGD